MRFVFRFLIAFLFVGAPNLLLGAKSNSTDSIPLLRVENVSVYVAPNPASDYITISVNTDFDFILFSSNGKQSYSVSGCSESYKMDVSFLSPGIYILNILVDENIYTKRVIIERK